MPSLCTYVCITALVFQVKLYRVARSLLLGFEIFIHIRNEDYIRVYNPNKEGRLWSNRSSASENYAINP